MSNIECFQNEEQPLNVNWDPHTCEWELCRSWVEVVRQAFPIFSMLFQKGNIFL
jgi:hypothetical protein